MGRLAPAHLKVCLCQAPGHLNICHLGGLPGPFRAWSEEPELPAPPFQAAGAGKSLLRGKWLRHHCQFHPPPPTLAPSFSVRLQRADRPFGDTRVCFLQTFLYDPAP